MENINITIAIKDGKLSSEFSRPASVEELTLILGTAQLSAMNRALDKVPTTNQKQTRDHFYDMYNIAAGNLLSLFDPEANQNPTLTEQAILEAENRILNENYQTLTKEEKERIKNEVSKMQEAYRPNRSNE